MAELPLEPALARSLLVSGELGCSEDMLTVAAALSVQSLWVSVRGEQRALDEIKLRFAVGEGDHLTYLNVFRGFSAAGENPQWCGRNMLNYRALSRVSDIRKQLSKHLRRMGIPLAPTSTEDRRGEALRKAITAGFFANAVKALPGGGYVAVRGSGGSTETLHVHPTSVLFRATVPFLVYHATQRTDRVWIQEVTKIETAWLTELAPHFYELKSRKGAGE